MCQKEPETKLINSLQLVSSADNLLDPDQARLFVRPADLGPNCLTLSL